MGRIHKNRRSTLPKKFRGKKKKTPKIKVEDSVFEFTPSLTGSKTVGGHGVASGTSKSLKELTEEAIAMKKHLEKHMNGKDSEVLLNSVKRLIDTVAYFCKEVEVIPSLMPCDKSRRISFRSYKGSSEHFCQDVNIVTRRQAMKGHGLRFKKKSYICVLRELAIKDPYCMTPRKVSPITPSPLVDPPLVKRHGSLSASLPPPLDPNRKLPETIHGLWLEFNEFNKGIAEERSMELDHPIVSVIGDFAIAVFNKAVALHVKKRECNNLHDFEIMECKYRKSIEAYNFIMTIEGIEEGHLGVYETEIVCSFDGRRTLSKFVLTDQAPVGTKAMAISHFSRVRSMCKAVYGVTMNKLDKLHAEPGKKKVNKPGNRVADICLYSLLHEETMKDLRQVLSQDPQLLFTPDCIRTTNRDGWSHPDDGYGGMARRTKGAPCWGYDYYNPYGMESDWWF